jgi:hypothetical protein
MDRASPGGAVHDGVSPSAFDREEVRDISRRAALLRAGWAVAVFGLDI